MWLVYRTAGTEMSVIKLKDQWTVIVYLHLILVAARDLMYDIPLLVAEFI